MNKKELIRTLYREYANKNETIGFMIVTAVDNDVSETVLRDILQAEAPIKEKTAKIFANIMGVDYEEIYTFNDIKESLRTKEIEIRGVVINDIPEDCPKALLTSIPRLIEEFTNVKILGLVPHLQSNLSPEDLITAVLNGIDIESIFNVKIEKLDMN